MTEQETSVQVAPSKAKSLADMVAPSLEESSVSAFGPAEWAKIAIVAGLLVILNFEHCVLLVGIWMHDPNWMHGFIIPLFSLYLLYSRRHELAIAKRRSCAWGIPIVLAAMVLQLLCVYPVRNDWFYDLTMVLMMLGLTLWLGGPRIFVLTWVPIAFLVFAMPIPPRLYTMMAYPLQEFAARSSYMLMRFFGAQMTNVASTLDIVTLSGKTEPVAIVEMCSGMRSLMAFVALGVAMAYLEERPVWQRVVFIACTVPVAILCNVLRVTITCTMFLVDKPELGKGFMHEFTGMLMLIPAFGMLWVIGRVLRSMYVEDDEEDASDADDGASGRPAGEVAP